MTNAEMATALFMDTLEEQIDYLMSLIMHRDKDIAKLQADNRSLVEQMNKMTMRIEHKSETTQIEKEEKMEHTRESLIALVTECEHNGDCVMQSEYGIATGCFFQILKGGKDE